MHGSEQKDGMHSTPEEDPRPKLWPRVLGSMAIVGFTIGTIIGRLQQPVPVELEQIEELPTGLALWFDEEPRYEGRTVDGAVVLRLDASGRPWSGQLRFDSKVARWKLERGEKGLVLTLLAARPLQGDWRTERVDGRWRLEVSLREE
ncbi:MULTISPECIES: hypothetical protein [Pseudomonas syringae group]|uniref:hypothetical protein n=1 Tax=Pseudomonas syringae group TaxID=136849 RepID=UPI000291B23A|nr:MULTISPECIES: hypothetical protein [Pseudomonas syringae group]EKN46136.1 hypothetical protein AAI_13235 [Pseudomonas viridiflava UASWS0038]KPL63408.1 hypothetical protein PVFL_17080 [Pseudomonas viridiflava]KPZ16706.1 Uncharacterized protein ALO56_05185 [Pseudomonas viridiflava]OAG87867.1 hypothetical protein AO065_25885 [Pseudomonas viridiflava]